MATMLHPNSSFSSQTSLSGHNPPATPPYTPAKHKRPFERSDSPASSIHPTETSSPAKKVLKRTASDNLIIVELPDSGHGSPADADTISPAVVEEVEDDLSESQSESDDSDSGSDSDLDSETGITNRFSELHCDEQEEELEMTQNRLRRRLSRRTSMRVFKRLHSQTAGSENGDTDIDDTHELSAKASARRLRRRVLSPVGSPIDWEEEERSSPELIGASGSIRKEAESVQRTYASVLKAGIDEIMNS